MLFSPSSPNTQASPPLWKKTATTVFSIYTFLWKASLLRVNLQPSSNPLSQSMAVFAAQEASCSCSQTCSKSSNIRHCFATLDAVLQTFSVWPLSRLDIEYQLTILALAICTLSLLKSFQSHAYAKNMK